VLTVNSITSQKSIDLVKGIYNDILPRITSQYFSPGGDELNAACFNNSHPTADFATSLDNFIAKTQSVISKFKKTRIVWEDLVLSHNTGLSTEDTILAVWTSSAKVMEAVKRGYRIIHAASDYFCALDTDGRPC
jgi:hexosaminidase